MTTKGQLIRDLSDAHRQIRIHIDENSVLQREIKALNERTKELTAVNSQLWANLDESKAKLTDSIREKAMNYAVSPVLSPSEILAAATKYEMYLRTGSRNWGSTPDDLSQAMQKLFEIIPEEYYESVAVVLAKQLSDLRQAANASKRQEQVIVGHAAEVVQLNERIDQLTHCAQELVDALVWSAEYAHLPAVEGWSWYDALKKHAPAALESFIRREKETTEADVSTSTEAPMTPGAVKEAVISIMSRETGATNLRAEVQLAHEWVTEKDDFQDRLSALAMAEGNRAKAKVIYSLRRGEV